MVEPITTTILTTAVKVVIEQLGPPIMKETEKSVERKIEMSSALLNSCETKEQKTLIALTSLCFASEIISHTITEGVINGVDRYIKKS